MAGGAEAVGSVPEVVVLQGKVGDGLLHQRDRILQRIALASGNTNGIPLDACLHLELALLDRQHDLLREDRLDAGLDRDGLLDLVAADLLDLGAAVEKADVAKLTKRSVDARFIDKSAKIEKIGGDKVKQLLVVKSGIDSDSAKKIQTVIKQSKLKVQAAIQGDTVRVTGSKRDELQAAMALVRKEMSDAPLSFNNFRD